MGYLKGSLIFLAIVAILFLIQIFTRQKFKQKQIEHYRVREAMDTKESLVRELIINHGVKYPPRCIYMRIFKEEGLLEVWASSKKSGPYTMINCYRISGSSGVLGPKREEGDKQVPEGFYYVNRFNPMSKFYLSLGINYPNESDLILGVRDRIGENIFIHGGNKTIGCIPITDESIKEVYILAVESVSQGQDKIPVHIFPRRLDEDGMKSLNERYKDNNELLLFWKNLKEGFDIFESTHKLPEITVHMDGRYVFR